MTRNISKKVNIVDVKKMYEKQKYCVENKQ